jgi:LruC domain-containing protein
MKTFTHYFLLSLLVIFASCQQNDLEADDPSGSLQDQEVYTLSIPAGFNFSTERKVTLNITDATPSVRYQVYGYSSTIGSEAENISDAFNNLMYSGEPYNGSVNFELSISNLYDKVYVSRNDGVESSFEITDISNNTINISSRSVNTNSSTHNGNRGRMTSESFYPGGTNMAHIAFEDLWPSQGDYDFNDLVISYRIVTHLDASNDVVSMDYEYDVTTIGAAYSSGFGIEFPFASNLYTVTGQRGAASGGETSANGSVVQFFDNANLYLDTPHTLTITFNTPQSSAVVDVAPYNPFLIVNGDTNYEVHLAGGLYTGTTQPTTFPGFAPSFAQANNDVNADYTVDAGVELNVPPLTDMGGMPWAINIAGTYVPPLPGEFMMKGHLKFLDWAQSEGLDFPDWFMDLSGYRDSNYLEAPVTPPSTVPYAPTIGTTVVGNGEASVPFTAPLDDGGSAITGYTATSSPGGFTGTLPQAGSGSITVSGLTNGTAYTFSVTATNAIGTSTSSAASNSVTPQAPAAVIGDLRDGGIVFWVDTSDNTKGKVCMLAVDEEFLTWYDATSAMYTNTDTGTGVYSNWYLPSSDELQLMYANLQRFGCSTNTPGGTDPSLCPTGKGDFPGSSYWSSTEVDDNNALRMHFGDGYLGANGKVFASFVRAVRAF